jgi:4-amino-4-deoxy-L-arabinose transferase-like glycosyltransferase
LQVVLSYDSTITEPLYTLTPPARSHASVVRGWWDRAVTSRVPARRIVLGLILLGALAVRLSSLSAGVPYALGIDEPAVGERALRIIRTGDWNPHIFDYPTLVIYLHAVVALVRFMVGASRGEWASLADFRIADFYLAGRFVSACLGTATVWLTYRIGRDAASERTGLIAAAQLALLPMHVRESHFMLTDVPATALTTLTLYLATRIETIRYWLAGVVAGLAAAAKYNGGVAIVAVLIAIAKLREPVSERLRMIVMSTLAAAVAFLVATPFVVLDLPTFLNSFAAQMSRLAQARATPEPVWLTYLKHFALSGVLWLPLAGAGLMVVVFRRATRNRWLPVLGFGAAYFYMLAAHPLVFASYALPLAPVICLLAAAGIEGITRPLPAVPRVPRRLMHAVAVLLLLAPLLVPFGRNSLAWDRQAGRRDTRQMAADWIRATLPPRTRVAVENNGPTYLSAAGLEVIAVDLLIDHPIEWYLQQKVQYLVVSSAIAWAQGYADAGPRTLDVPTSPEHPGPAIRVVRLQ